MIVRLYVFLRRADCSDQLLQSGDNTGPRAAEEASAGLQDAKRTVDLRRERLDHRRGGGGEDATHGVQPDDRGGEGSDSLRAAGRAGGGQQGDERVPEERLRDRGQAGLRLLQN